jgi:hypothetical protein
MVINNEEEASSALVSQITKLRQLEDIVILRHNQPHGVTERYQE